MNPPLTDVAARVAELIRDEAVPALGTHYAAGQLLRASLLLQAAAHDFEHGAAWRVDEIGALQSLLGGAAPDVDDPTLAASLRDAAQGTPTDLRISALDARLAALHTVLVALHSWTETSPAPGARRLNTAIWHTLRDGTERRRLAIGHF